MTDERIAEIKAWRDRHWAESIYSTTRDTIDELLDEVEAYRAQQAILAIQHDRTDVGLRAEIERLKADVNRWTSVATKARLNLAEAVDTLRTHDCTQPFEGDPPCRFCVCLERLDKP